MTPRSEAPAVLLADFLAALFAGCEGFMEFRALPSKARLFPAIGGEPPRILTPFLAGHASQDLYVGVSSRRDRSGGDLTHCQHLGALFADVDFKATPEPEARERIARCPLRPSALVRSGGGLHIYYFLREPLVLSDEAERAKHLLRRLARALGGDLVSAEPARILRVPGTRNHKPEYGAPQPVVLEALVPAARYNLHELEEWLPEEPAVPARPGPFTMPEQVREGTRNDTLYKAVRSMKARGYSPGAILAALEVENAEKCDPPLPAEELAGLVQRAVTQPDRPLSLATGGELPRVRGAAWTEVTERRSVELNPTPLDGLMPKREAFYGLAGRVVECIAPTSEADPAAILLHVLIGMGNLIGRTVYATVEKTVHPCNEFAVLVGQSAKGRKGQAWSTPRALFESVSRAWVVGRVRTGLSSGEGLIFHVRDKREELQPVKKGGKVAEYELVMVDEGEADKRLLVFEPELASVLRRMNGETSSLSAVLRQAWESGDLSTLTRNNPLRATGAHVSVIAHVTREELIANLTETERANGFANRFLFCLVKRSKILPEGGAPAEGLLLPLAEEMRRVLAFAAEPRQIHRTPAARDMWAAVYPALSEGEPELLGAILARAEAHVLRLSLLYAALDGAPAVDTAHLEAALALWDYADASARMIFGGRSGMADQDTLVAAIRARGPLSQTEVSGLFHRNKTAGQIEALVTLAEQAGKIRRTTVPPRDGRGRPVTTWEAV